MNRSPFTPAPAPGAAGRREGPDTPSDTAPDTPGRPGRRRWRWRWKSLRAMIAVRQGRRRDRGRLPFVAVSAAPAPGEGRSAAEAVLAHVLAARSQAPTVILDLADAAEVDADGCAALCWLHSALGALGKRLRLSGVSASLWEQLRDGGVADRVGPPAVHASCRAAILATYAALPGAGIVTSSVRLALATAPEPVAPARQRGELAALGEIREDGGGWQPGLATAPAAGAAVPTPEASWPPAPGGPLPAAGPAGPLTTTACPAALRVRQRPSGPRASPAADGARRRGGLMDCARRLHATRGTHEGNELWLT